MLEEMRGYYEGELQYLTDMGVVFSKRFPKVAQRLGISEKGVRDPHAERIIQGVALLNARIRRKLDDEFPEIVESLLGVVYPHFLRPFPSAAIASFQMDARRGDPNNRQIIPSGTCLVTSPVNGTELIYRTCGDLTLWPLQVRNVEFMVRPFDRVDFEQPGANSVLRVHLRTFNDSIPAAQLNIDQLRFYLNLQPLSMAGQLFELLLEKVEEVTISSPRRPREHVRLGKNPLNAGRRHDNEALIPDSARSFSGYRILSEQYACPESFLFVNLPGLSGKIPASFGNEFVLNIFFSEEHRPLARAVSGTSVQLGAVPVVNLFPKTVQDVPFTEQKSEFRVIPDAQQETSLEIYSINAVDGVTPKGERIPIRPFFDCPHGGAATSLWHATRRPVRIKDPEDDGAGYDQWLSVTLPGDLPESNRFNRLSLSTICFNRSIPNQLQAGGRLPDLRQADGDQSLSIAFLTCPTSTRRPSTRESSLWELVSHLSLNYLSIDSDSPTPHAFRSLLQLYESPNEQESHRLSRGIVSITCRPDVAVVPGVIGGFCRGVEVTIVLDDSAFSGTSPYIFAMSIREFLSRYVGVNSFVRQVAMTSAMKEKGQKWIWAPQSGTRRLL